MAQVHRFREKVAVHVGDGSTQYLSPSAAEKLGRALIEAAENVRQYPKFSNSPNCTVEIDEAAKD